ncbi:hypothetical protein H2200_002416 [Cladophialophora chaetospira]|uniref:Uncharacterized protein n=1 Tax=Cladophialophora chaetospira TaxID=386627 RepID=A0AA38XIU3_9EURO|nr:hypothetical protein H2200_002416 [Cladophialophora chaetospira]
MSRVNCNGVHPELIDGYLVRTTAATSAHHSGAIGVSTLQSSLSEDTVKDVVTQLNSCHAYEAAKRRLQVPSTDAKLRWCSQIVIEDTSKDNPCDQLLELLSAATQVDLLDQKSASLRNEMRYTLGLGLEGSSSATKSKAEGIKVAINGDDTISFVITFDAISEYCTANATSRKISFLIGSISLALILSLYVLELKYSLAWRLSTGWILALLGYLGIVVFVTLAARHIQRSSHSIPLRPRNAHLSQPWTDGLVIAAQSDSKTGAEMLTAATGGRQSFEAVWLRPLTSWACIKADFIGTSLTLSFLCHYLGLRSSTWWLGLSELVICISAAFARS